MTINEINEVLIHAYAYCGFPRSLRAIQTFMQVVDVRKAGGINDTVGRETSAVTDNRSCYEAMAVTCLPKYRAHQPMRRKQDMPYLPPTSSDSSKSTCSPTSSSATC